MEKGTAWSEARCARERLPPEMEIEFIKLNSCGRDYIVVDTFKNTILRPRQIPDMAARITNRRFGVGGQGLVLALSGRGGRLRMLSYGRDGRECPAEPQALRCLARYAFDAGLAKEECFTIEGGGGKYPVEVIDSLNVMVATGPPFYWEGERILKERSGEEISRTLALGGKELRFTPVYVSAPHAVFHSGEASGDLHHLVRALEGAQLPESQANISVVRIISREEISLRTWEAGRGETYASESAACAAVVASVLNGFADRQVVVHCEGGNLFVEWSEEDNLFYTSGPAEYVFLGSYYYEEAEADEE